MKYMVTSLVVIGALSLQSLVPARATAQPAGYTGLLSPDEQVRWKTVKAAPPGPAAIPLLVAAASDECKIVRDAALARLASRGREAAARYLAFLADEKGVARGEFDGIGDLLLSYEGPGSRVRPTDLSDHMAHTRPDAHRVAGAAWAVWAGAYPGDLQESFEVLGGVLEDPNEQVKQMAGVALALLAWSTVSAQTPATCEDLPGVLRIMDAESPVERRAAYCLLGMLRVDDPDVIARLRGEQELTFAASVSMAQIAGRPPLVFPAETSQAEIQKLVKELEDLLQKRVDLEQREVRWQRHDRIRRLLRRLPQSAEQVAVPILTRILAEEEGEIVVDVAERLLSFSPEYGTTVVRHVARALAKDSPGSMRGLRILGRVGSAATPAIPKLIEILNWPERERPRNPRLLAEESAKQGPSFMLSLRVKRNAIDILGALGPSASAAREQLARLLDHHEDWLVRVRAARALRDEEVQAPQQPSDPGERLAEVDLHRVARSMRAMHERLLGEECRTYLRDELARRARRGVPRERTEELADPLRGQLGVFDEESTLHYYRARYYDSARGRFLQRDPLGHALGPVLMDYVEGRPATAKDPSGLTTYDPSLFKDPPQLDAAKRAIATAVWGLNKWIRYGISLQSTTIKTNPRVACDCGWTEVWFRVDAECLEGGWFITEDVAEDRAHEGIAREFSGTGAHPSPQRPNDRGGEGGFGYRWEVSCDGMHTAPCSDGIDMFILVFYVKEGGRIVKLTVGINVYWDHESFLGWSDACVRPDAVDWGKPTPGGRRTSLHR